MPFAGSGMTLKEKIAADKAKGKDRPLIVKPENSEKPDMTLKERIAADKAK